jgi:hypothetical protein
MCSMPYLQTGSQSEGIKVSAFRISELSTKDVVLDFAALASLIAARRCGAPTILDCVRFGQVAESEITSPIF